MKHTIAILFIMACFAWAAHATNDPNTLVKPPQPKVEYISRIDDKTIRITTSIDITKDDLLRQKKSLEKEIERKQAELAIINKRLAAFN